MQIPVIMNVQKIKHKANSPERNTKGKGKFYKL